MSYLFEKDACDPNKLLDTLLEKMELKNDAALCRRLDVAPPVISKLRHCRSSLSAALLIRMHEESGLSIKELRLLLCGEERSGKLMPFSSSGLVTRLSLRQNKDKIPKTRKTLPAWTEGLEIQIARVLMGKGFKCKSEVLAALERGDRIDRIGTTRQAVLRSWLDTK